MTLQPNGLFKSDQVQKSRDHLEKNFILELLKKCEIADGSGVDDVDVNVDEGQLDRFRVQGSAGRTPGQQMLARNPQPGPGNRNCCEILPVVSSNDETGAMLKHIRAF
jgi:hypothetical protein